MARIAINPGEGRGTIYLSNQNTDSEITLYLPIDNTSATLLTKENSDATLANYVTQTAMEEYVGLHGSNVPTGTIMFFAGSTAPEGFIVWQNIKIYQTQYPNLYAVLNTAGGFTKGTDSTGAYVTLPDINGRVLQATTTASQVGALLEAQLPTSHGCPTELSLFLIIPLDHTLGFPWKIELNRSLVLDNQSYRGDFRERTFNIVNSHQNHIRSFVTLRIPPKTPIVKD